MYFSNLTHLSFANAGDYHKISKGAYKTWIMMNVFVPPLLSCFLLTRGVDLRADRIGLITASMLQARLLHDMFWIGTFPDLNLP